jgi:lipopolysaccharide export system permease protein
MKILFITSNRVGDAVLSTGLLAKLVEQAPTARFTIACGPYASGLFRGVPRLDRLHVLEKKRWNRHWFDLWLATTGTRWDLIVDLRDSIVSRLLRADRRVRRVKVPGAHKVIENAAAFGMQKTPPAPYIWIDRKAQKEALEILPSKRPLLALGPAANWPCKQWPIDRFAALALKLTTAKGPLPGAAVLVIADHHERPQLEPLLRVLPPEQKVEVLGRDLPTVAACLKECRLFIGNDSGLMHLAAAVGTPTLGLFGPGYEEIYGPFGSQSAIVRTDESREELLRRLPNLAAKEPNLMTGLSVEKAYKAATDLLARTNA